MIDVTLADNDVRPSPPKRTLRKRDRKKIRPPADLSRDHLFFVLAALIYLYFCLSAIDLTYIDFGDGNYLYLSWRLAQGDRLYAELPSPQPPLHLFVGSLLIKLGAGSLVVARTFQALLRIATGAVIWALAWDITQTRRMAALAGIIYIWLPEGVWWSRGYQSEPLLIFLLSVELLVFLRALLRPRPGLPLVGAGAIGSLAVFTNMTALPYLALQTLYLFWRHTPSLFRFKKSSKTESSDIRPGFFWVFTFSLAVPCAFLLAVMNSYSDGQYVTQVWSRQWGTFPTESVGEMLGYSVSSLVREYGDIVTFEGGFALLALLGLLLYQGVEERHAHSLYLLWWGLASLGSIIFVIKGGTVEYIFTLGEPAVAIFSSFFLYSFLLSVEIPSSVGDINLSPVLSVGKMLAMFFVIATLCVKGGWLVVRTMENSISVMEFPEQQVKAVLYIIESKTEPDDPIIAPPFYAYASQRRLAAHFSYDFMLAFAYYHEYEELVRELNRDPGLPTFRDFKTAKEAGREPRYGADAVNRLRAEFQRDPSLHLRYSAISMFLEVNRLLNQQKIPLAIANRRNFVTWVPLLHQPLRDQYEVFDLPVGPGHPLENFYDRNQKILYSREEQLQFFVPRRFEIQQEVEQK